MSRPSEDELRRFRAGDEALYRRLVAGHSPRLLALARSFARDMDEAHDLLQETWQRIYRKRDRFDGSGTWMGWFYAVCRNVCLARSRHRRPEERLDEQTAGPARANPATDAERLELRRSIYTAVMELPPRERDVVVLRLVEGRSTRETASELGCAEGTVKAALHHALRKLQGRMGDST